MEQNMEVVDELQSLTFKAHRDVCAVYWNRPSLVYTQIYSTLCNLCINTVNLILGFSHLNYYTSTPNFDMINPLPCSQIHQITSLNFSYLP